MSEKTLQTKFISWLNRNKIIYYKHQGGIFYVKNSNGYQPICFKKSFSDIVVYIKGKAIFIEVKRLNAKLRDNQIEFKNKVEREGFKYFILKEDNINEIKEYLLL